MCCIVRELVTARPFSLGLIIMKGFRFIPVVLCRMNVYFRSQRQTGSIEIRRHLSSKFKFVSH